MVTEFEVEVEIGIGIGKGVGAAIAFVMVIVMTIVIEGKNDYLMPNPSVLCTSTSTQGKVKWEYARV